MFRSVMCVILGLLTWGATGVLPDGIEDVAIAGGFAWGALAVQQLPIIRCDYRIVPLYHNRQAYMCVIPRFHDATYRDSVADFPYRFEDDESMIEATVKAQSAVKSLRRVQKATG